MVFPENIGAGFELAALSGSVGEFFVLKGRTKNVTKKLCTLGFILYIGNFESAK
jgi:hypothetical protein